MAMGKADPSPEPREPDEIIPPPPGTAPEPSRRRTFFHPYSGLVILGVDWFAFGLDLPAGLLFEPLLCALAFGVTYWAVLKIQFRDGDQRRAAAFKALLGGLAAGVPFPVTGTIVGVAILMLSGLSAGKELRR